MIFHSIHPMVELLLFTSGQDRKKSHKLLKLEPRSNYGEPVYEKLIGTNLLIKLVIMNKSGPAVDLLHHGHCSSDYF